MTKKHEKIEYIDENDGTDDKIKKVKKKLKVCQDERAEYLAGWQRAKADLINYKKEQEKKNSELFKFANEGLILEILLVLDSLDLAIQESEKMNEKHATAKTQREQRRKDFSDFAVPSQSLVEGIKQVRAQLMEILKNQGLEEIKAVGEKFNPEFHESVESVKSDKKPGTIIEEVQKGYKLNNKLIRPSRVKISK